MAKGTAILERNEMADAEQALREAEAGLTEARDRVDALRREHGLGDPIAKREAILEWPDATAAVLRAEIRVERARRFVASAREQAKDEARAAFLPRYRDAMRRYAQTLEAAVRAREPVETLWAEAEAAGVALPVPGQAPTNAAGLAEWRAVLAREGVL